MASEWQCYLRKALGLPRTNAFGLTVFFAHSWRPERRTWFSEVMIFIVWHHQKAIPCLFGIRSLAGAPLWLILYSLRALCLPVQCSHESLIPFELSNATVSFHQPAHSAELHQPLLCKASHSSSEIDWVSGSRHKDKGGQTQQLRFALRPDAILIPSDF